MQANKGWETRRLNVRRREKQQRVLFVVGPDRCGKTNIVRAVCNATGIKSFKASSEHATFLSDQSHFVNDLRYADPRVYDLLFQTCLSVVFDRGYPCEWVYSRFYERESDFQALAYLDEGYAKMGAKILICTRKSFDGIQDDLDARLDSKALMKISDLYNDFKRWTKCETYTLYVDDENLERELSEVLSFLNRGQ